MLITLSVHADAHETSVTSLLKSQTQAHRDNNYMSTCDKELQLQNMQNLPFIEDGLSSCTFKNTGPTHRIKQTITCASKNLIYMHDTSVENAKISPTHQQNISDRRNAHYETDLENTEDLYNTTADDAVPQHFNRYDALSQRRIRTVTIRKDRKNSNTQHTVP